MDWPNVDCVGLYAATYSLLRCRLSPWAFLERHDTSILHSLHHGFDLLWNPLIWLSRQILPHQRRPWGRLKRLTNWVGFSLRDLLTVRYSGAAHHRLHHFLSGRHPLNLLLCGLLRGSNQEFPKIKERQFLRRWWLSSWAVEIQLGEFKKKTKKDTLFKHAAGHGRLAWVYCVLLRLSRWLRRSAAQMLKKTHFPPSMPAPLDRVWV